jgi:hypothetical protein
MDSHACSPDFRRNSFALVQSDGSRFRLDITGKRSLLVVNATGAISKCTIQVDSIALAR